MLMTSPYGAKADVAPEMVDLLKANRWKPSEAPAPEPEPKPLPEPEPEPEKPAKKSSKKKR